jgi:hypothetical protein
MLFDAGFDVLLVSNSRLTDPQILKVKEYCFQILERKNIGRDFGAYNHGIKWLELANVEIKQLVLLNDSVFYPDGFSSWIERTKLQSGFGSLTINYQFKRHAQSFYLFADTSVLKSKSWSMFWKQHIPFSSRIWNIKKGEIELTNTLRKSGIEPTALLQGPDFRSRLSKELFKGEHVREDRISYQALYSYINDPSYEDLRHKFGEFHLNMLKSPIKNEANQSEYWFPIIHQEQFLDSAEKLFNTKNPFWSIGLTLPTYFNMPLKKDLMRRLGVSLSHILETPGYSFAEIASIKSEFIKRGTSADIHGLFKLRLFEQGRID